MQTWKLGHHKIFSFFLHKLRDSGRKTEDKNPFNTLEEGLKRKQLLLAKRWTHWNGIVTSPTQGRTIRFSCV